MLERIKAKIGPQALTLLIFLTAVTTGQLSHAQNVPNIPTTPSGIVNQIGNVFSGNSSDLHPVIAQYNLEKLLMTNSPYYNFDEGLYASGRVAPPDNRMLENCFKGAAQQNLGAGNDLRNQSTLSSQLNTIVGVQTADCMPHKTTRNFSPLQLNPYYLTCVLDPNRAGECYQGFAYRGAQNPIYNRTRLTRPTDSKQVGCAQQLMVGNLAGATDPMDPVWMRRELDNCTNQYILQQARFIRDPDDPGGEYFSVNSGICQPFRLETPPTRHDLYEYVPSEYLGVAWAKLLIDHTYLYRNGAADTEPNYAEDTRVQVTRQIPLPSDRFGLILVEDLAEQAPIDLHFEKILDPSHPYTPRWDFDVSDRSYSPTTAVYSGNPTTAVRCSSRVPVDLLNFRKHIFERWVPHKIAWNTACYLDRSLFGCYNVIWRLLLRCSRSEPCCSTRFDVADKWEARFGEGVARAVCGVPMREICNYVARPLSGVNTLKMRPATDENFPNGVPEGYKFEDYFGDHKPYMRCWDTNTECGEQAQLFPFNVRGARGGLIGAVTSPVTNAVGAGVNTAVSTAASAASGVVPGNPISAVTNAATNAATGAISNPAGFVGSNPAGALNNTINSVVSNPAGALSNPGNLIPNTVIRQQTANPGSATNAANSATGGTLPPQTGNIINSVIAGNTNQAAAGGVSALGTTVGGPTGQQLNQAGSAILNGNPTNALPIQGGSIAGNVLSGNLTQAGGGVVSSIGQGIPGSAGTLIDNGGQVLSGGNPFPSSSVAGSLLNGNTAQGALGGASFAAQTLTGANTELLNSAAQPLLNGNILGTAGNIGQFFGGNGFGFASNAAGQAANAATGAVSGITGGVIGGVAGAPSGVISSVPGLGGLGGANYRFAYNPNSTVGSTYAIMGAGREGENCAIGGGLGQGGVANPDPISSWSELKLYYVRGIRQGAKCIINHEKIFKASNGEDILLMSSGAEPQRKELDTKGAESRYRSYRWPFAWRGYISDPDSSKRFPNLGNRVGPIRTGLDQAIRGEILIFDQDVVMAGAPGTWRNPYVAFVKDVVNERSRAVIPNPTIAATLDPALDNIRISAFNHGRYVDACGNTDMLGMGPDFALYKEALPPPYPNLIQNLQGATQTCDDPLLSSCIEPLWGNIKRMYLSEAL